MAMVGWVDSTKLLAASQAPRALDKFLFANTTLDSDEVVSLPPRVSGALDGTRLLGSRRLGICGLESRHSEHTHLQHSSLPYRK